MKLESSYIYLDNVRFHAYHGVLEQERKTGGDFLVSLRVGFPIEKAMCSDDVSDTLNYAALYEMVKKEITVPSKLLENVAYRICRKMTEAYPEIESVELKITKKNPPMGADCDGAGVEMKIINKK
ncbi:MAG: dihydroneopterin aldolase [Prevotella sp.]|nr:dihydroneopterin aldolase [Prevotella sp.]